MAIAEKLFVPYARGFQRAMIVASLGSIGLGAAWTKALALRRRSPKVQKFVASISQEHERFDPRSTGTAEYLKSLSPIIAAMASRERVRSVSPALRHGYQRFMSSLEIARALGSYAPLPPRSVSHVAAR